MFQRLKIPFEGLQPMAQSALLIDHLLGFLHSKNVSLDSQDIQSAEVAIGKASIYFRISNPSLRLFLTHHLKEVHHYIFTEQKGNIHFQISYNLFFLGPS